MSWHGLTSCRCVRLPQAGLETLEKVLAEDGCKVTELELERTGATDSKVAAVLLSVDVRRVKANDREMTEISWGHSR